MALVDDCRFRIFIKREADGGDNKWYEISGNSIVSTNYKSTGGDATVDAGMKINTTVTFDASGNDRICIITHINSGGTNPIDSLQGNFSILKANTSKNGSWAPPEETFDENPKLKYCMCDRITLGGSNFHDIETGGPAIPHNGDGIATMEAAAATSNNRTIPGGWGAAYLLIGRNNMGWNVSILDGNYGMGDQGTIMWPDITGGESSGGSDSGVVADSDSWVGWDTKDVTSKNICQPANLANNGKSGWTMIGWYKSPLYTRLKLIDPYNIVEKLYYYDGTKYIDMSTDIRVTDPSAAAGTWNGPSSLVGNGKRAQAFNIFTDGCTAGVWVKVTKTINDFPQGDDVGGFDSQTDTPTAPWLHLCYR